MTPANMAVSSEAVRSIVADAARRQLSAASTPRDRQFLSDMARPGGERIPQAFVRFLEIACAAPSLTDALAVVHAMERVIVRHHTATHRLCLTTAIVDDADADNIGNSALARYATDKSPSAIEALVEAAYAEKVSAMVLAAAGEVTHARLTSGRPLSLAR